MKKELYFNDLQIPFHDPKPIATMLGWAMDWKPDTIHILGDLVDLSSVSRYKDRPGQPKFWRVQTELNMGYDFLGRLRDAFPKTQMVFYTGNHEDRLRTYPLRKAPELHGLEGSDLDTQLGLTERGYGIVGPGELRRSGNLWATHGHLVRKHSAGTAKAHFDAHGVSVIHGHSHRGGVFYKSILGQTVKCYENFCLCRFDQHYLSSRPDWQQGWSACFNDGRRGFHLIPLLFEHGHTNFLGTILRPTDAGKAFVKNLGSSRKAA